MGAVAGWYISPESLQKGYDPGIDDYMVKSGDFSGLLMRVRALLRRANIEASRKLSVDGLLLYADALTASLAGAEIPVTIREFNILYELLPTPTASSRYGYRRKFCGSGRHTEPAVPSRPLRQFAKAIAGSPASPPPRRKRHPDGSPAQSPHT